MKVSHIAVLLVVAAVSFGLGARLSAPSDDQQPVYGDDALERFAELLQMDAPGPRASALAHFFSQANPTDAEGLRDVMNQERPHVDSIAEMLFASWWAGFAPELALEQRFHPPRTGRHPWVRAVFSQWARTDPETALAAAVEMPSESWAGRQEATRALMRNWFSTPESEPGPLLHAIAVTEGNPRERAAVTEFFLESLIEARGLDAAEAFVGQLEPGPLTGELEKRLAVEVFGTDPDRAIEWALAQVEARPRGWGPLVHLAARWGWEDGEAAMKWSMALPESEYRDKVVIRAFRSWLSIGEEGHKGDAARQWIAGQELTRALEGPWAIYAQNVSQTDLAEGARLAAQLTTDPHRSEALRIVGRRWLDRDPKGAQAWLKEAHLSPKLVAEIRAGSGFQRAQRARASDG
jgi:hypothetical protein